MEKAWMKKMGVVLVTGALLTACGDKDEPAEKEDDTEEVAEEAAEDKEEQRVTFEILDQGEEVAEKEFDIEDGTTVLAALQEHFETDVEDSEYGAFVKGIEGIEQDESEGLYWLFEVNDEMAEVGAGEYELEPGDEVTWDRQKAE